MTSKSTAPIDVLQEVAEVENALFDGCPPSVRSGVKVKTAGRQAAERLGTDRNALRAKVGTPTQPGTFWRLYGIAVDWSMYRPQADKKFEPVQESKLGGSDKDRQIVALQDEVSRLNRALKDAHREANTADIIREMVGRVTEAAANLPPWVTAPPARLRGKADPEVPVTCWSDWHLGEVVEPEEVNGFNAYNMQIAGDRIERLIDKTIMLCREHHTGNYPGIVVNLVGDFISGGLHPELAKTDEEETIPACIQAIDWVVAGLRRMADAFGRVYVPAVAGNHGRQTAKPEFKRYYKKNFDWLIYQMVASRLADDKRISFDIRPSNDVHYKVFGVRYLLLHGDMLGVKGGDGIIGSIGPIMRGEVKKSGQSSALGMPFDQLIMGHWHQRLWLPRAIVSSTIKGFDEYARLQLGAKPDRPTQALWFVHPTHGMTAHWDVYVDDPKKKTEEKWVSVFSDAA